MRAAIILSGLGLLAGVVWLGVAPEDDTDHLLISEIVAAPLDGGGAAAFLKIENRGAPDRLIGVESRVAEATLYSPEDNIGPPVPVGASALAPDSAHIRLQGPLETFRDGALIPLTLTFANAGKITTKAKVTDPKGQGRAEEVGLFGIGEICIVGDGEPAPTIELSVTSQGDGWRLLIETEEFTFSEDFVGLYHVPGMGHGHLYVGGMKMGRLYAAEAYIGALPKGQHEIRVTLNTNDHRAYVVDDIPVTAKATIEVE
ncbi:MAG: copper chaperone PCu(A)C [Pseudomonadota bacterium]